MPPAVYDIYLLEPYALPARPMIGGRVMPQGNSRDP